LKKFPCAKSDDSLSKNEISCRFFGNFSHCSCGAHQHKNLCQRKKTENEQIIFYLHLFILYLNLGENCGTEVVASSTESTGIVYLS